MHMKIEINYPENISPPPEIFQSPEQTQHHGNNPNPPEKIPNTSESISTPPKKFKLLPEKSQPPRKTPPLQK